MSAAVGGVSGTRPHTPGADSTTGQEQERATAEMVSLNVCVHTLSAML